MGILSTVLPRKDYAGQMEGGKVCKIRPQDKVPAFTTLIIAWPCLKTQNPRIERIDSVQLPRPQVAVSRELITYDPVVEERIPISWKNHPSLIHDFECYCYCYYCPFIYHWSPTMRSGIRNSDEGKEWENGKMGKRVGVFHLSKTYVEVTLEWGP